MTPGRAEEPAPATLDSEQSARADDQPKTYGTILEEEIFQGLNEMKRPPLGLFLSGLSAGLDIGFTLLIMASVLTIMGGDMSDPATKLLVSAMYPIGFVFVIVGRSELFTEHTTLAVFPVLGGKAGFGRLARLWGLVYSSNIAGTVVFAAMAAWIGPALGAFDEASVETIAKKMLEPRWSVILGSAILAGWMMGLLSWLLAAAQETISRILVVWLVTAAIGVAGLHHCIVGSVEVLTSVMLGSHTIMDFGRFLLWASLGNALGGVFFVGVIKYSHAVKGPAIPPRTYRGR